jgi:hypothetical protein
MLAASTRLVGLILLPALAYEALYQKKFELKKALPGILWILFLTPLGFIFYIYLNDVVYGNPWEYVVQSQSFWGRSLASPWEGFQNAWSILGSSRSVEAKFFCGVLELVTVGISFLFVLYSCFKQRPSYAVYMAGLFLLLSFNSIWAATPRYLLTMFPIFSAISLLTKNWPRTMAVTVLFIALQIFFLKYFLGPDYLYF